MFFAAAFEKAAAVASLLLPAAVAVPFAGALLTLFAGRYSEKLRNFCAVSTALLAVAAVAAMHPLVTSGPVRYVLAEVMQTGLVFHADYFSFVFALLMAVIWLLATVHATAYMAGEHARTRFFVFLLLSLGSCLGVVLAGDLISLFLFFEMLTLFSYVLVIHEQTTEAMNAGAVMLYLSIAGGLSMLFGIFLLLTGCGTVDLAVLPGRIAGCALNPYPVLALLVGGFGVKAGMIPLHIWLPKAHPVAPSPASALLSGLMIKIGAYGIFRVMGMLFLPLAGPAAGMGRIIIWIGIVTMFGGALMALLSTGAKKILAYSSVSQMGYILMGIGAAAYLGPGGVMGFAGALYHIINHAFFKTGLFLIVGSIYMITRVLDIEKTGGLAGKLPLVAACFLIAFAGIGGIPGFNGYVSKTILHHAIVETAEHSRLPSFVLAEKIFVLTGALTLCYFAKLFSGLFLGELPRPLAAKNYRLPKRVYAVLFVFAAAILAIGLFPSFLLEKAVIPGLAGFSLDAGHLHGLNVWNFGDLRESLIILSLAAVIYPALLRLRFFAFRPPYRLSLEYLLYRPVMMLLNAFFRFCTLLDGLLNRLYLQSGRLSTAVCNLAALFDASLNEAYERTGGAARKLTEGTFYFDESLNKASEKASAAARDLDGLSGDFDESLNRVSEKVSSTARGLVRHLVWLDRTIDKAYRQSGRTAGRVIQKTAAFDNSLNEVYTASGGKSQSLFRRFLFRLSCENIKKITFDAFLITLVLVLFLLTVIFYLVRN